ncbi:BcRF1 [macacine gammaherpesvirus 10]|uniref:BcRF1 n=1 Tax=macacine gammaherpesvirus 10 TaxID=2560569 RepID=A0A0S0DJ22_9GAMA|nr:BcRF1 [macacine gammaherpesvirus 10]ALF03268.1 BcRF1 [macacine gammaherpesvirus 10]
MSHGKEGPGGKSGATGLEGFSSQLGLFYALACNRSPPPALPEEAALLIKWLDSALGREATFYACRAMRRLLLGVIRMNDGREPPPGLIILSPGTGPGPLGVQSLEHTDAEVWHPGPSGSPEPLPVAPRVITYSGCPDSVNTSCMFRLIIRYLSHHQFERCYEQFCRVVPHRFLATCGRNFAGMLAHLKRVTKIPPYPSFIGREDRVNFHLFSWSTFMLSWPNNATLREIRTRAVTNLTRHPGLVDVLYHASPQTPFHTRSGALCRFVTCCNCTLPNISIRQRKVGDRPEDLEIILQDNGGGRPASFQFPSSPRGALLRSVMAAALLPGVSVGEQETPRSHIGGTEAQAAPGARPGTDPARKLVALLRREDGAPKDPPLGPFRRPCAHATEESEDENAPLPAAPSPPLNAGFQACRSVPVGPGFRLLVFNTNRVINTKLVCSEPLVKMRVCNVPRLINNFVARKYVVKETAFTVSLFFTDGVGANLAINVNISGTYLSFLLAMTSLRCFLPVEAIYPAAVSNWNSTLDLHGLENQSLVRENRSGVFWTTNFPSVVSCQDGLNVSWFKAATATISRVHGRTLEQHLIREITPIVTHRDAKISRIKNRLFTLLELRNRSQIQVPHKRFLEGLLDCASLLRLDPTCINRIASEGLFDFSKRTVAHSKNRHECALLGHRLSANVTKLVVNERKTRLDILGRNANFLTRCKHQGDRRQPPIFLPLLKHISRRLGLGRAPLKREINQLLARLQKEKAPARHRNAQV